MSVTAQQAAQLRKSGKSCKQRFHDLLEASKRKDGYVLKVLSERRVLDHSQRYVITIATTPQTAITSQPYVETSDSSPDVAEADVRSQELPLAVETTYDAVADEEEICDEIIKDRLNSLFEIASELPTNDVSAPLQHARYAIRNVQKARTPNAEQTDPSSTDGSYRSVRNTTRTFIEPSQPPEHHTTHHSFEFRPRRRRQSPVTIYRSSEEDNDEDQSSSSQGSTTSLQPNPEHGQRAGSLSPTPRYEAEKEITRLRELRERERGERIKREELETRERAAILERLERQREIDERLGRQERRQRIRREERETRERQHGRDEQRERESAGQECRPSRLEREAIRQQKKRDREQARIQQEREDIERLRDQRAWQLHEERLRLRIEDEREEIERLRAQRAWRHWEEEDIEREMLPRSSNRYVPWSDKEQTMPRD